MKVETFAMERMQSLYEHEVEFNLTESGVSAIRLDELVDADALSEMARLPLSYPEAPGSNELRANIASWYPDATVDNVTVMAGGAECNYSVLWTLIEPGDEVAIMVPNYMQTWGIAQAYGRATPFHFRPTDDASRRWALDVDELDHVVSDSTKLIVITNPNNPTGGVLSDAEMEEVVRVAASVGAWVMVDEIYRGSELGGRTTATFWDRYDRLVVTSGLSKSFGLPGLRIGWVVAPPSLVERLWIHHDYLSIMPGVLSERLATITLRPGRREEMLTRTRAILNANLPLLEGWIAGHEGDFDYIRPLAGAMSYLISRRNLDTAALTERLRREESVLIVPGEQLGLQGGIRLGFGHDMDHTLAGLERFDRFLDRVRHEPQESVDPPDDSRRESSSGPQRQRVPRQ